MHTESRAACHRGQGGAIERKHAINTVRSADEDFIFMIRAEWNDAPAHNKLVPMVTTRVEFIFSVCACACVCTSM